jgi:hypothetical protein
MVRQVSRQMVGVDRHRQKEVVRRKRTGKKKVRRKRTGKKKVRRKRTGKKKVRRKRTGLDSESSSVLFDFSRPL